jgi:hypothetical protein
MKRIWLGPVVAALLGGCVTNGDFGRVRPFLVNDDMHAWVGPQAVAGTGVQPSEFRLTDDERRLRDLAYALIQPPYDRNRWSSVFAEYGLAAEHDTRVDPSAYWYRLHAFDRRSEASAYAQIVNDARNDVLRIEPFFAIAARVLDMDRKRAQSLAVVGAGSGLSDTENNNALRRNAENAAVTAWVCRSLNERHSSYRYALERLVVSVPSPHVVETERALNLLQARIGQSCLHK